MPDVGMWTLVIGLLVVVSLGLAALTFDGAYQVATGRAAVLLPFDSLLWKRVPATELECVRQGGTKLLQAMALTFIDAPVGFLLVQSTAHVTGLITPASSRPPAVIESMTFVAIFGSLAIGLVLMIAAYVVGTRVKFAAVDVKATAG